MRWLAKNRLVPLNIALRDKFHFICETFGFNIRNPIGVIKSEINKKT
ncbi:unknown protein [Cronobacter turicensis z3032]|uniref:Uncharacterized protein n=1 Tax=Cronobacter turicensis (strain DSM 18703 / CCUG 55852 / LMG 23827 / z3032) TaxID=693216 RepID=C9Y332_CROTZ|nr:unknown protein [Cronobacter turicensis z3032]